MFKPDDLFDLSQTEHAALFDGCEFAWEVLKRIPDYIRKNVKSSPARADSRVVIGENVFIGEGTILDPGVSIKGPAIIGRNCHLRQNAYLRENVILGDGCVVGNSSEVKNSLLFNNAGAPHFNYVGDSVLGFKAHVGAGVVLSNLKSLPGTVRIEFEGKTYETGLRKFGALLGDYSEIGCNAVLNPGSIIGRNSIVYPCTNWRGVLPPGKIVKNKGKYEVVDARK